MKSHNHFALVVASLFLALSLYLVIRTAINFYQTPFPENQLAQVASGGPVISNVTYLTGGDNSQRVAENRGTILWRTDVPSDSVVEYIQGTSAGAQFAGKTYEDYFNAQVSAGEAASTPVDPTMTTSHRVKVDAFAGNNLYRWMFRVKSRDTAGNLSVSPVMVYNRNFSDPWLGTWNWLVITDAANESAARSQYKVVQDYWARNSYGSYNPIFSFKVIPTPSTCSPGEIIASIGAEAQQYDLFSIETSMNAATGESCFVAGNFWVDDGLQTTIHEMSHRLGLNDDKWSMLCTTATDCTYPYNLSLPSIMSARYTPADSVDFSLAEKEIIGFVNNRQSPGLTPWIEEVTKPGTYRIGMLEVNKIESKGIKILRDYNPATREKYYYYFELRDFAPQQVEVSVARNHGDFETTATPPRVWHYMRIWADGGPTGTPQPTFTDTWRGITVTMRPVSGGYADLDVSFTDPVIGVGVAGTGRATISSTDGKISCGLTCSATYKPGAVIEFNAAVESGSSIVSWDGCDYVNGGRCVIAANYTGRQPVLNLTGPYPNITPTSVQPKDIDGPTITVSSPADGSKLPRNGSVTIAASAVDPSGVSYVSIAIDGKPVAACIGKSSCSYSWRIGNKVVAGLHTIAVLATDLANPSNMSSKSIQVTK